MSVAEARIAATTRRYLDINGIQLCVVDYGGDGPPALLLHGLGGRGSEWRSTAYWLRERRRVYALDQRGHGMSQKGLADYSRDAFVTDVVATIERLGLGPTLLIGQSMGGINAFIAAGQRPDLVHALVVAEASPGRSESAPDNMRKWVETWPLPFATLADARSFFGGETLYASAWIEILEERPDGYWPQFRLDEMVSAISDIARRDYWSEWERVRCPTLVIGAERGFIDETTFERMRAVNPTARHLTIADAGHDLHLDQPDAWRATVERFVNEIDRGDNADPAD